MAMTLKTPLNRNKCIINVHMFGYLAQPIAFFERLSGELLDRSNIVYVNLKYDYG